MVDNDQGYLVGGLEPWTLWLSILIGNVTIPTDEVILFRRVGSTTNQGKSTWKILWGCVKKTTRPILETWTSLDVKIQVFGYVCWFINLMIYQATWWKYSNYGVRDHFWGYLQGLGIHILYYVYHVQPSYFYNLTYRFLTGGPAWKNSSVYSSQVSLGQVAKDSTGLGGRICSLTRLRDLENVKKGHKSMIFRWMERANWWTSYYSYWLPEYLSGYRNHLRSKRKFPCPSSQFWRMVPKFWWVFHFLRHGELVKDS